MASRWLAVAAIIPCVLVISACKSGGSAGTTAGTVTATASRLRAEMLNEGLLRSEDLPQASTLSARLVPPNNPDGSCTVATPETKTSTAFQLANGATLAETISVWKDADCVMALVRRALDAAVAADGADPRHTQELPLGSLGDDSAAFTVILDTEVADIVIIQRGDLILNIDLSRTGSLEHQLSATVAAAADRRFADLRARLDASH